MSDIILNCEQDKFDQIKLYKDIFSSEQVLEITEYLKRPNWEYGHYSSPYSKYYFWNMNLETISYFTDYLFKIILEIIGESNWRIDTVYANGQTYGLDGSFHTDDINGYTFLYYANTEWKPEWGGYTLFAEEKTKKIKTFYPEPNSALFFPGHILHYGQSPSRDFCDIRTTIAYKIKKYEI